jgi:hypothetical protein
MRGHQIRLHGEQCPKGSNEETIQRLIDADVDDMLTVITEPVPVAGPRELVHAG